MTLSHCPHKSKNQHMNKENSKKILFYTQSLFKGGTERVVTLLAEKFATNGFDVTIGTLDIGEGEFALSENVKRVYLGLGEEDRSKSKIAKVYLRIKYLKKYLIKNRPDIIISFLNAPTVFSVIAAKGLKIPVIITERSNPELHLKSFFKRKFYGYFFKRASGYVFQTGGQLEFYRQFMKDKENARIILNPLDERYINVPKAQSREKAVVHHARLVYFKNQELLIRAFLKVHKRHGDYVLKIYGEDSGDGTKEKLESLIRETQSEKYVLLMGGDYRFEEVIPKGSVYVFSSDWEGLPNSLIEAMAMGLPIVATDCPCGGPRTLIENEVNGLLVPVKDEEAISRAVNRLIEDRELAESLAEKSREVKMLTDPDSVYLQWREYIESIISKHKA